MITKKIILLMVSVFFMISSSKSQITINLALNSRPQPWLNDWNNPINGQLIISYIPVVISDPNVKLRTTLLDGSGAVIASSNTASARVYRLKDGVNLFSIADALQFQNLTFSGKAQTLLQRTGRLSAGLYQMTVEVVNTAGDVVRAKQTKPFSMVDYQLPLLMSPSNEASLEAHIAQRTIVFRWTSLIPAVPELPEYRIQIFEILPDQTPMQAFRGNRPLLNEKVVRGTTQYVWRPQLAMLDSTSNKRFIWTIQTFDREGMPLKGVDATTQGRSTPFIFKIERNIEATKTSN
ncbi:hypothetical protein WG904_16225 [Pedobacter sp. Du54]|uniref:hypothetical protein n=1 Tax=Pedobacter anseongensis TaxID=3133439 RepID=UPI0030AC24D7